MAEVEVEVVVVAGLEVVVAGLAAVVVVVVVAGLEVVGAFGATVGLWARAMEAIANKAVNDFSRVVGLMVAGILEGGSARRQAPAAVKLTAFLLL